MVAIPLPVLRLKHRCVPSLLPEFDFFMLRHGGSCRVSVSAGLPGQAFQLGDEFWRERSLAQALPELPEERVPLGLFVGGQGDDRHFALEPVEGGIVFAADSLGERIGRDFSGICQDCLLYTSRCI